MLVRHSNHFGPVFCFSHWRDLRGFVFGTPETNTRGVKAGECAPAINLLYDMPGAVDQSKLRGELKWKNDDYGLISGKPWLDFWQNVQFEIGVLGSTRDISGQVELIVGNVI